MKNPVLPSAAIPKVAFNAKTQAPDIPLTRKHAQFSLNGKYLGFKYCYLTFVTTFEGEENLN